MPSFYPTPRQSNFSPIPRPAPLPQSSPTRHPTRSTAFPFSPPLTRPHHHPQPSNQPSDVICGHEPCGQIASVGPGCRRFRPGDRVILYHIVGCGRCSACNEGYALMCEEAPMPSEDTTLYKVGTFRPLACSP